MRFAKFLMIGLAVPVAASGIVVVMSPGADNNAEAGPAAVQRADLSLSQMGVFRRPRTQQDVLPPLAARSLAARPLTLGENPDLSRSVRLPSGLRYLVPGRGVVNFMTAWGSGGAAAIADVLAGQVVESEVCTGKLASGQIRVVGLLPDTARNSGIVLRNGTRLNLEITDNAYEMVFSPSTAEELPAKVVFDNAGKTNEVPIPGSDDEVLTSRCPEQP
jgi:hypothetical protein